MTEHISSDAPSGNAQDEAPAAFKQAINGVSTLIDRDNGDSISARVAHLISLRDVIEKRMSRHRALKEKSDQHFSDAAEARSASHIWLGAAELTSEELTEAYLSLLSELKRLAPAIDFAEHLAGRWRESGPVAVLRSLENTMEYWPDRVEQLRLAQSFIARLGR